MTLTVLLTFPTDCLPDIRVARLTMCKKTLTMWKETFHAKFQKTKHKYSLVKCIVENYYKILLNKESGFEIPKIS